MPYTVALPDGRTVEFPDEVPQDKAAGIIQRQFPEFASPNRTWGEAVKDVGAGLVSGVGSLVQLPGQLYGLATGDFAPTGALGAGEAISKYGKEMMSPGLKAREAASEARVQAAEDSSGEIAAFITQAKEIITDPAQLTNFLAETLPQMLLPGGAAKLAAKKALASAIAKGVAEDAAKTGAVVAGVAAAKGVGAVQQGADIGAESYKQVYDKLVEQKVSPADAAAKAINLARGAGASAAVVSWLAQSLPGASALEAKFAGKTGGPGRLATGLKESISEMAEEGPGKAIQNVALQQVDPTQQITQGVGAVTAKAGVAGAGMGVGLGGQGKAKPAAETSPVQEPPAQEPIPVPPTPLAERPYPELAKEVARISALADTKDATPEEMGQLKAIRAELQRRGVAEVEGQRAAVTADKEGAEKFPGLAGKTPTQMEIRGAIPEGPLPPETDLFGNPVLPKAAQPEGLADVIGAELPATSEGMRDAGLAPTTPELEAAGQQRLPLRRSPAGQPTTAPPAAAPTPPPAPAAAAPTPPPAPPAPAKPGAITATEVKQFGTMSKVNRQWLVDNVEGKTPDEVRAMVEADPTILTRVPGVAKAVREIIAQATPKEAPSVPSSAPTPAVPPVQPRSEPRGSEPSVGVPVQPTGADTVAPGATGTPRGVTPPVSRGLVPPKQPAAPGVGPAGQPAPALTAETAVSELQALINTAGTALAKKRAAVTALAALQDPKLNETAEDKAGNLRLAAGVLGRTVAPAAPVVAKPASPTVATPPAPAGGMFGQLVKPGATNIVEDEAPPPATPAKPASPFDVSGPSIGAQLAPTSEETKAAAAVAQKPAKPAEAAKPAKPVEAVKPKPAKPAKPASPSAISTTPPVQETAKPAEAAKPAEPTGPRTELETVDAINGRNLLEVAQWGAANFTSPDFRLIAQRVADTLQILKNVGLQIGNITVTDPGNRMTSGARGATHYSYNRVGAKASTVSIMLNHPDNGAQSGTSDTTILHELIHAATVGATRVGNLQRAQGTRVSKAVTALYDVGNAVTAHIEAKQAAGKTLSKIEQTLLTNYRRNVDEVLAWTLTDRDTQAYMETVPYKGTNAWDKFVTLVRDMLGLTPKADTALSEILRIGGELTSLTEADLKDAMKVTGKQFSLSPTSEALIAGSGAVDPVEVGALKRMINAINADPGVDYVTKFRTQVADIAATIESRLTAQFDGAVKDALGNLNPMGLYRQAQDYTKMLLEFFQQGSLMKNPATGLWEVSKVKGVRPPAEVYKLIDDWGKANGLTREEATKKASRILEAVRLDGLRTANNTQGASFTLHKIDESSALSIDQQINALLADYRADPALKEMNKLMDESRNALVDHLVTVGRLTVDQGKDWKDVIGYVPFDRLSEKSLEKFSKIKRVSGKGLAQVGKLPELKGTTRLAVGNVFNSYIDTMGWMVGQIIKTDGTVQTLRSLEKVSAATALGLSTQNEPNVVGMYVDGVMNYWSLPSKYDVMAFKDLNPPKAGWLLQMGAFSNVLRKAVTILPPFALKQVTDDVQRAILTSGVKNPAALLRMALTNFPKLALAELRGIQHPTVREFGAMGLTGEYDFQAGKPAASLLKDLGIVKRGKFENILHKLDGITRASDLAVRKAIYDQTLKEGGDKLLAQTRAREFINFRRRGASEFVGAMVTTIPFFNAYVQGMDVLYRAASGKDSSASVDRAQARRLFWSRAATVTMMASLYALGKDDDDKDYNEMDLRTRDNNWIFPGGYKLSVPGELGAIFKVIPERVVEYMRRQGTPEEQEAFEAVRTALSYMYEQYLGRATPVPQAIKPLMEAWANKSFLTGRPLEGFHQQGMDPSARVGAQTSEIALAIAKFSRDSVGVEVSPIMIDNALRGYFGSTTALLTTVTDSLLNPTRVDRPLHKWALISNYMYDPTGTRLLTEFYEERDKMGKANNTLNQLAKTDMDRAEKYAIEHQEELAFESAINSTLNQLSQARQYVTFLNSPDGAKEMPDTDQRTKEAEDVKKYEVEMVRWLREAKTEYRKANP